jgi:DNA-binding PadR family transcriptional regulator
MRIEMIKNMNSKTRISDNEMTAHFVKSHIEFIVLSILSSEPMCGKEIIDEIAEYFGVLMSPGTMYPLLRKLERQGLVRCESGIKRNTYMIPDSAKANRILNEYAEVCASIMKFINTRAGKRS